MFKGNDLVHSPINTLGQQVSISSWKNFRRFRLHQDKHRIFHDSKRRLIFGSTSKFLETLMTQFMR